MLWLLVKKTPGQNAWSRDEEGKHAMATGQELTQGWQVPIQPIPQTFSEKSPDNKEDFAKFPQTVNKPPIFLIPKQ